MCFQRAKGVIDWGSQKTIISDNVRDFTQINNTKPQDFSTAEVWWHSDSVVESSNKASIKSITHTVTVENKFKKKNTSL